MANGSQHSRVQSFLYNAPYFFSPGAKVPHLPGDFGRQLQLGEQQGNVSCGSDR
jgi:hypothetical protein